jgi:acyl-CoA reductase-like NAD-dependent aldehyde dehydrogenase
MLLTTERYFKRAHILTSQTLISRNFQQPYTAALNIDLDEAWNVFRYYAGAADKITGQTIETSPAKLAYVMQEPLGVCGQIIPWYALYPTFKDLP